MNAVIDLLQEEDVIKGRTISWICCVWASLTVVITHPADADEITYQGQLTDQGAPATGVYQVQFQLFDAVTGGMAHGVLVTNLLTVTNGLFTTTLDFGQGVFNGSPLWLALSVSTNGSSQPFTILSPRQAITAAPQSVFAETTSAAGIVGILPDSLLSTNVAQLDADAIFSGALQLTNPTNTFQGTFTGDGSGLSNVSTASLVGGINTTNPLVHGATTYGTDISSITDQVSTNFAYPTEAPAGHVWRSLVPVNDAFGQSNWCDIEGSAIVLNPPFAEPVLPTGYPTVTSTKFVFGIDGDSFVIPLRGNGSYLGIQVDGADDGTRIFTPSDVQMHNYTVTFASSARRQIELELSGNYQFAGLFVPVTNGLWSAVLPKQHRLIVVGDSISEDTSSSSWTSCLMTLFRNVDVWSSSVGSTGYINPGTPGRVNFQDRIGTDVVSNQPDYVLFAGGINDNTLTTNAASASALTAACVNCFQMIQNQLPNCKIVVLGPFWPGTPGPPSIFLVNNAISNACQTVGIGSNYVDTLADPWVTGVWNQPGSGSAVNYTLSDGTHPTQAGSWNIAYHVAGELARRFPEFEVREKTR